jgi:hypothetical protein
MYRSNHHYGWKPDLPDHRDLKFTALKAVIANLPPKVDLRSGCPPVYDQGQLGSCTGNAIAAALEFELIKQSSPDFTPARLFIYYNERVIENTVDTDSGAQIRDGIKTVNNQGVCPETMWPYVVSEFAQKPFSTCYTDALTHTVTSYQRVDQDIDQMKGCIAQGYPIVVGFTVYPEFESPDVAQTGIVNLPGAGESPVGGHAVLVVGYDDSQNRFIVRNSWGPAWGMAGYFTMPYAYLTSTVLSSDFWTIRVVANNPAMHGPNQQPASKPAPALKDSQGHTANLKTVFRNGSEADTLTAKLMRVDGSSQPNDQQSVDFNGGTMTFNEVKSEDVFIISGLCIGTATLTVDIPMKVGPPASYPAGNIFDNLIVQ